MCRSIFCCVLHCAVLGFEINANLPSQCNLRFLGPNSIGALLFVRSTRSRSCCPQLLASCILQRCGKLLCGPFTECDEVVLGIVWCSGMQMNDVRIPAMFTACMAV